MGILEPADAIRRAGPLQVSIVDRSISFDEVNAKM